MCKPPSAIAAVRPVTRGASLPRSFTSCWWDGQWALRMQELYRDKIPESLKAEWNGNFPSSRDFPDCRMMGLPAPCACVSWVLLQLLFGFPQLSLLCCFPPSNFSSAVFIQWNCPTPPFFFKYKNNEIPLLEVHHHILALPKSPTSADSSNNNKNLKRLVLSSSQLRKIDVDLAVLFPSDIWQRFLSPSPSPP